MEPVLLGNLAVYLPGMSGRTGIVAKGCDTRSIVELIREKQVKREDLVILGVPCRGMIDGIPAEVRRGGAVVRAREVGDDILFHGEEGVTSFSRVELLLPDCRSAPGETQFSGTSRRLLFWRSDPHRASRTSGSSRTSPSRGGLHLRRDGPVHSLLRMQKRLPSLLLQGMLRRFG
jgi:hypothetical protein